METRFIQRYRKLRLNPASDNYKKPILPLFLMAFFEAVKEKMTAVKGKLLIAAGLGSVTLVQLASAATLNESISPILTSVTELFVPLLALVVAAVPLIISIAVIGFILGIFSAILGKLHI